MLPLSFSLSLSRLLALSLCRCPCLLLSALLFCVSAPLGTLQRQAPSLWGAVRQNAGKIIAGTCKFPKDPFIVAFPCTLLPVRTDSALTNRRVSNVVTTNLRAQWGIIVKPKLECIFGSISATFIRPFSLWHTFPLICVQIGGEWLWPALFACHAFLKCLIMIKWRVYVKGSVQCDKPKEKLSLSECSLLPNEAFQCLLAKWFWDFFQTKTCNFSAALLKS